MMISLFLFFLIGFVNSHSPAIYGVSGWSTTDASYLEVLTPSYPDTTPVPGIRNRGFVTEHGLLLTDTGFMVTQTGDYLATITAVLYGNETSSPEIEYNVFLIQNNTFSPTTDNLVGASNSVTNNQIVQFQGTNILRNVERGTTLSLVINNGVGTPTVINLFAWGVILLKL